MGKNSVILYECLTPVAGNQDAGILGTKPLKANVKKSWMQELLLASFMPGNIEFSTPNW